jgi:maltose alpha-D-glucosyltransferase / alpha-amylase
MATIEHGRAPEQDPLWYKDAVIYELHVRAFRDDSGDGMGDFRGLTQQLDYLEDLGVTAIWLLPFYPSPWRDDGYDIADYTKVHATYGTMRDFREFLREAHRRGLKVITELVINHTSDQHPWFQKARRSAAGTKSRAMYVWSDTDDRYAEARIIFTDTETSNWAWDPVAQAYYWHRFFSHQPDLNFDNTAVHDAIFRVMDFWFRLGVDGMRLDAVPYLYEREGTNCENLPETYEFLKKLRRHVDERYEGRMLLAEANQWPEDTVPYFGDGDACHMAFHFPVMPRLFMAVWMEDRFPIIDILEQTPPIPDNCQWAMFLRNHDELTLEMVTDEERDYMYRVYANDPQARINVGIRRRLAPLLNNSRRKIELLNALLFALPGTPVIYYGDEIGMGDNIYVGDRNGVRTPMQWSADRNAGFSRANPQRLYLPLIVDPEYHYETVNVEAQQANPSSLLWWMKRLIALRKQYRAFGRGNIEFLLPDNRKVLAFLRRYDDECILVVANLSRMVQYANLDLARFEGTAPVELFGRTEFPRITEQPYFVTLGPHAFYWFELRSVAPGPGMPVRDEAARRPPLSLTGTPAGLDALLAGTARAGLERILPRFLLEQRWFQSKTRTIRGARVREILPLAYARHEFRLLFVEVTYVDGDPETYVLPIGLGSRGEVEPLLRRTRGAVLADVTFADHEMIVYDATADKHFRAALFALVGGRRRAKGTAGELVARAEPALRRAAPGSNRLLGVEQSNTSIVYDEAYVLKMYRRLEEGMSLDYEIGRFLTDVGFLHTPAVLGAVEYRAGNGAPRTLVVIHQFVPNEGDAWALTLDMVAEYFERAAASPDPPPAGAAPSTRALLDAAAEEPGDATRSAIGTYIEDARLIGQRVAELHLALALDGAREKAFEPEPFTVYYQRSVYQSMRNLTGRVLQQLRSSLGRLPAEVRVAAEQLLEREPALRDRFRLLIDGKVTARRTRHHGDLHLGQLLFTGKDYLITDFEGEPIRPLSERRLKRSPLRDVAGMLRSFHYAVYTALLDQRDGAAVRAHDRPALEPWANFWYASVSAAFLREYLLAAGAGMFLPPSEEQLIVLLDASLLEKAVYELGYELNNRPDWAMIPLRGLLHLLHE